MRTLWIAAGLIALLLARSMAIAQSACYPVVELETSVEVAAGELSLADLLAPNTCAALRQAAASVTLGQAPSVGSVRVLSGGEALGLLWKLAARRGESAPRFAVNSVPERITVRRAGPRASCAALEQRILNELAPAIRASGLAAPDTPREMTCGAAARVAENAPLEITQTLWDASLNSWQVKARCLHPGDCVPVYSSDHGPGAVPR